MSLLDDAGKISAGPCPTYWEWEAPTLVPEGYGGGTVLKCAHCRRKLHEHAEDCPVVAMPRIVTVLEIAARIAEGAGSYDVTDADFAALVAAMKGEAPA
jgi:hypothetical protein